MSQDPRRDPPHPRREPRIPLPLTLENTKEFFANSADFICRPVALGDGGEQVHVCYLIGMVKTERLNEFVLKPMMQDRVLAQPGGLSLPDALELQVIYAQNVQRRTTLDQVAKDIVEGGCAIFLPGEAVVLTVPVPTEDRRSVGEADSEPALKGSRESFTEALRVNTAMVRRHLRAPELAIREHIVGRQSLTPVDVVYLEGIADPEVAAAVEQKLDGMDIDGVETAGNLEEYLVDAARTPFPLIAYTQRPDRFCQGLLEGRVGLLADGIPLGWLVPATADQFFKTAQDRSWHWLTASALSLVRYLCALLSLVLPGLYIALVTFHPEAIPVKLALSIAAAKQEVPFSTIFEVLILLLAFEVVQEAGLRLPGPIGATVSILGGLVVGNAAVEARIVSPAVLIAVAIAGVAGYTQPSQDMGNALRLCRFLLAILASVGGLFGLVLGLALLTGHLAGLESFGVPYLAPFTSGAGAPGGHPSIFRLPLPRMKWRDGAVNTDNRRNQR